ncbi:ATPase, T2SS/T4P/T4SS family [Vibrio coralliirubri]|uniref:ATPase, T2SS/T4P/T4SS family n=1 Tax=Vibrio coralliirubri TaxID=1516159 RepID=UPI0022849823|nr:ATPase, T2SS/T4P/T4SS family [Vibrio coralliirubri]MCY9861197.1 ATPase, T2SS/T4P/T4SS family [Vibrio coralliirubri]
MEIINKLIALGIDPNTAKTIHHLVNTDAATIVVGGIDTNLAEKVVQTISTKLESSPTPQSPDNSEQFKDAIASSLKSEPDCISFSEVRNEEQAQLFINAVKSGVKVFAPLRCSSAFSALDRLEALGVSKEEVCESSKGITALIYNTAVKRMCPNCSRSVRTLRVHLNEAELEELESLRENMHPFIDKDLFDDLSLSTGEACLLHPKNHIFTNVLLLSDKVRQFIKYMDEICPSSLTIDQYLMALEAYNKQGLDDFLCDKHEDLYSSEYSKRSKALCEAGEIDLMEVIDKL